MTTLELAHFGPPDEPLFGVWHHPSHPHRDVGVVICPPFGREAPRAHPLARRIAEAVVARGYCVLRFDFYGTGDSAGEAGSATLTRWCADVEASRDAIARRSGASRVCMIGIRFGGLLAAHVGASTRPFEALALVDPVPDGGTQIDLMRGLEQDGWAELFRPSGKLEDEQRHALMGIPFRRSLLEEVKGLSLAGLPSRPAGHVGAFLQEGTDPSRWAEAPSFEAGFERRSLNTTIRHGFAEGIWPPGGAPGSVADWLEACCP